MVAPHKNRLEKQKLIAIISKYEAIIDRRKADRKSIIAKRKAWIKISSEFNRLPNVRPCNTNQLKRFWSNLKARDLQMKKSTNKLITHQSENNPYLFEDQIDEDDGRFDDIGLDSCDSETNTVPAESISSKSNHQIQHSDTGIGQQEKDVTKANGCLSVDSVINAQLSKLEMSICHMRELHQLAVQRERLQVRLLEQQLEEQTILHQFRLDNEREIHQLRIKREQELHLQRMRFDEDQRRIHEVHGYPMR